MWTAAVTAKGQMVFDVTCTTDVTTLAVTRLQLQFLGGVKCRVLGLGVLLAAIWV
jgi:hypothetical protein